MVATLGLLSGANTRMNICYQLNHELDEGLDLAYYWLSLFYKKQMMTESS